MRVRLMRTSHQVWGLVAVVAVLGGCSSDETAYERGVADWEPVYCYRTLADADCYRRPVAGDALGLINFYGPAPRHFADVSTSYGAGEADGADDTDDTNDTALMPPPAILGLGLGAAGTAIAGPAAGVAGAAGGRLLGLLLGKEEDEPETDAAGETGASAGPIRLDPPPAADSDAGGDTDASGASAARP
jgi:hypothetical protein